MMVTLYYYSPGTLCHGCAGNKKRAYLPKSGGGKILSKKQEFLPHIFFKNWGKVAKPTAVLRY